MTLDDLKEQIAIDVAASRETLVHLADLQARLGVDRPDIHEMAAIALYVRDLYHGLKNVMVRLLKYHGLPRPDGIDWHNALARMFTDPPSGNLPVLITADLREPMTELRGFRHVLQHRYAAHLTWGKLEPLAAHVSSTFAAFHANVADHLRQLDNQTA